MSTAPDTTIKIPGPLHDRLLRGSKKTGLTKAALLRLCVDIGVPQFEAKLAEMRNGGVGAVTGVGLAMTEQQLAEMRELYRSAVTDLMVGLEGLAGEDFVSAAQKALASATNFKPGEPERIQRFITVYAQLF
jgi:hypothetical protein